MKILFVSMPSIHIIRWIENLKGTHHELYWFDILDKGKLNIPDNIHQFTNWKKRKVPYVKGEYFLSKKIPNIHERLQPLLERTANEILEKIIIEIQPDVVHSFEMQSCSYPIERTMLKYPKLKWMYSCWGSDLFYYRNFKEHNTKIRKVLKRIDFLHTDCIRDFEIARQLGFKGQFLGVIPGGTGYRIEELEKYKLPIHERKIILVKGYEHHFGRGLNVVKALELIKKELENYEVVVFGAHPKVIEYINEKSLNYTCFHRHGLTHEELIKLMGKSLLYIGNSISDGIPNTLLEAIVMGAFPIQSNPGGATAEIITDSENGFLIKHPENIAGIKENIIKAITNITLVKSATVLNSVIAKERLDYEVNNKKLLAIYESIAQYR